MSRIRIYEKRIKRTISFEEKQYLEMKKLSDRLRKELGVYVNPTMLIRIACKKMLNEQHADDLLNMIAEEGDAYSLYV